MKTIVTHFSPDQDAITSIWLIKRYLPGWSGAQVTFVPAGKTLDNQPPDDNPAIIHVDTGFGKFDHHQTNKYTCAAKLVLAFLQKKENVRNKEQEALIRLIEVINEQDHFAQAYYPHPTADYYEFSLDSIINGLKASGINNQQIVELTIPLLDAILTVMKNKVNAQLEIKKGLIFNSYLGRSLAAESANEEITTQALKSGFILVIRKDPRRGNVRIKTLPEKKYDLTPFYKKITAKDKNASWFLHASKNILLNGSSKNPTMIPSRLTLGELIEISKTI